MTAFAIIAAVLTIVAVGLVVWPLLRVGAVVHPIAATLTALATPAVVLVVYLLISNYDWRPASSSSPTTAAAATPAAGSMEEAVASLERKLEASPADEEGWVLLGSSYLNLNRPADAAKAYQRAVDLSGGRNAAARLGLAEARIVLDPGALSGPTGEEVEAVLKLEPGNPKALWYGGMVSLTRGQPAVARERWTALLQLAPPERVRQIIVAQLAELGAGKDGGATPAVAAVPKPGGGPAIAGEPGSISITVSISDQVRGQMMASAPLFVFVRDAENAGPPLAVIRRQAGDLPMTLEISDADVMLPGRSLADIKTAKLVARIANGGNPIASPGDIYGEAQWRRGEGPAKPVQIVIDRVVAQ